MKVFRFSTDEPSGTGGRGRLPFAVQYQSKSPVLGCLLALVILVAAGLLAVGAGIVALIAPVGLLLWRAVKGLLLPGPAQDLPVQNHPPPGVIDVEATVLPPSLESERRDERQGR
ncbi:MAG: hypothetical protein JWO94_3052 [Verrucomicrobiaceae bacterium]|nr:hypothetical protein [Verrucomicrobiaceae bacterium]